MTPPEGLRLIDAGDWEEGRFRWLKAVRRDETINVTARLVAHVLVLDFANKETAKCNPSRTKIAEVLGLSEVTVKRAIRDLEAAAWIIKITGHGRARSSGYGFLTSAKVIPLKGVKYDPVKGVKYDPLKKEKGSNMTRKGVKYDPAYIRLEPYKNHRARGQAGAVVPKLSENPMTIREAEDAVARFRDGRADALDGVQPWVVAHVIAAALLTDDELAEAGWTLS